MQRYSAATCGGGVSNSAVGGPSARDTARADSSFPSSNFSLNPSNTTTRKALKSGTRRHLQITPYNLKCDKEPLSSRLGPPDFHPQTPNCPEETLTKEYLTNGYKESVEGIEEAREIVLSQASIWTKSAILRCKEAIRKHLRAINESRAQKRKAGQVYGVPLSGQLLLKPGVFPEQRPCGEEFRKKWIEGLSQQHKRLRLLADHVPHGYRRKSLFEALIRHNVPLLRASWFIKVTYLNQVRPASTVSPGAADKTQLARTELWTKDVIEYLQHLLDELFSKDASLSNIHGRDLSPQTLLAGSIHQKYDSVPIIPDDEEPSPQFKWQYMLRILQWHHAEGLLLSSHIIEWVLNQLQEKESVEALQLLLPIVFDVIENITLSQTYVRMLVDITVRSINDIWPSGSDVRAISHRPHIVSLLIEMLQYLMLAVPDTFVALDCFPLPSCVFSDAANPRGLSLKDLEKVEDSTRELDNTHLLSFSNVASTVQSRSSNLAIAVNPGPHGHLVPKVVQALDKILTVGDIQGPYNYLFENLSEGVEESWIAEVCPSLRSSLKWIGTVSLSAVYSVFLICEWATCDFRDCRAPLPSDLKFSGRKDFSQVHAAVQLLKLRMEDIQSSLPSKKNSPLPGVVSTLKCSSDTFSVRRTVANVYSMAGNNLKDLDDSIDSLDILQSPGPLHDIVVCWLDQHEASKGEGFKRLNMLVVELIRCGIFYPQAYVRQLIVSGIMDRSETLADFDRRRRHHQILKQLPGSHLLVALEEAKVADVPQLIDAVRVYSNERRLVLHGLLSGKSSKLRSSSSASFGRSKQMDSPTSSKHVKTKSQVAELKNAISVLLRLPNSTSVSLDSQLDMSQGNNPKRPIGSLGMIDETPGCEECKRAKRQKLGEERSSHLQKFSPSDDEDNWWVRKEPTKSVESSFKVEPTKSAKHSSRGRQKIVRKTQSLAQLAAARIEGSQGASTSHVCDNKISCPHHRTGMEGEVTKSMNGVKITQDVVTLGKALKKLRFLEKRSITLWLIASVRQLLEASEKATPMVGQCSGPFSPPVGESTLLWKLGEDELSLILYLLDVSSDLVSAVKFLLWLLPKVLTGPSPTIQSGRNVLMRQKNTDSHAVEVRESFLLSSIRRYENVLIATDLLPEALSAATQRALAVMASNGRAPTSSAFIYARNLLKKYGTVPSVKNFKATCDQRLLTELETGRPLDSELGFSPIGIPSGVEDVDDYFRQKISGRLLRAGPTMKDIVQRQVEEAIHYFYSKEKKFFSAATATKSSIAEKMDDSLRIAQQIVLGLVECIRQNGGAAQDGDPLVVAAAVSAIVGNVGPAIAKMSDFATTNYSPSFSSNGTSLNCARRIVHIHITCLSLLKEAFGDRLSRVFEIALAAEAFSLVSGAFAPGKSQVRTQFQLSPETHDSSPNMPNENLNSSAKVFLGRATKVAAAVSALVLGAVVHGVTTLERMITCFKLKEGLDFLQFIRGTRSSSNGVSRSTGSYKFENGIEVCLHWFRLLVGNSKMVSDGLVMELLGETYSIALSRMQRMLPLNSVFPPAYSIFGMVIWRPYILNSNIASREDIQLYQSLSLTINETIRHQPFRDLFLRDTHTFYELLSSDVSDLEFAAMLESHSPDKHLKTMAFVPLRSRLFLNSILDCKMPLSAVIPDDGSRISGHGEPKGYAENDMKLLDQLVHVLDTLQPAKFHWQWVELRLLLNEQVLIEKIETHNMSLVEAIRSLSPTSDNFALSENENTFNEIVLTRLLVRPDAAPLYSEVVHLLGRSLEESLLLHAKWFLAGNDVLLGRKSIRQRLINIAQLRGLSTKAQFWKPWGWSSSGVDPADQRSDKRKLDAASLEEGEVVEEGVEFKRPGKVTSQNFEFEGFHSSQQFVSERALAELVLPCIDRSSNDSRNTFASDLIKQMNTIEQQISGLIRGASKQGGAISSGVEGASNKGSTRKGGIRGGSPGLGRRPTGMTDSAPPSAAALRASMWLRLQFLLRLLPIICSDREPSARNMRYMLASVLLRLLGTRMVHEDADLSFIPLLRRYHPSKEREMEAIVEASGTVPLDLSGDSLFDRLLCVLHGLLSCSKPSWLKPPKSGLKSTIKSPRDFSTFDRELAESLQAELDRMQLPATIRRRLQAAMPMLPPSPSFSISCQPPTVATTVLASLQSSILTTGAHPPQRSLFSSSRAPVSVSSVKGKPLPPLDPDMEIDPWLLLEDGTVSGPTSSSNNVGTGADHTNLKANSCLKGAVRVRRTDLTYIGAVDDDT